MLTAPLAARVNWEKADILKFFLLKFENKFLTLRFINQLITMEFSKKLHQRTYLTNGMLIEWNGATEEVYSTISFIVTYQPTLLGTVHRLDIKTSHDVQANTRRSHA